MEYRHLGNTGLKVSALCLGTMQWGWTADETASQVVMDAFLDAGGNFIDTANVYSFWAPGGSVGMSEGVIGRWMQARSNRDKVILATKVRGRMWEGPNGEGLSRAHIIRACEESLRRLQTDYIDLYQTHSRDKSTPIEETMAALDTLVQQGKVRYLGCSNYGAGAVAEALWASDKHNLARYDSIQPHYNMIHRAEFERELAELCVRHGIGIIPYSPLGGGFLTGKYSRESSAESQRAAGVQSRYFNERGWHALDELLAVAKEAESTPTAVSLAWLLQRPGMTSPIIGANSTEQLQGSLAALDVTLTPAQVERLDNAAPWE